MPIVEKLPFARKRDRRPPSVTVYVLIVGGSLLDGGRVRQRGKVRVHGVQNGKTYEVQCRHDSQNDDFYFSVLLRESFHHRIFYHIFEPCRKRFAKKKFNKIF